MTVLVLFGSRSDSKVYEPFCNELRERGHNVDFAVISAHRQFRELEAALAEKEFDVAVGGAGLSAHLPGVIASQVKVPVFGIPVAAHLAGLDSLFSIFQMPFGVPVISAVPGRERDIAVFLEGIKKVERWDKINLVINPTILNYEFVLLELNRTKAYMAERKVTPHICDKAQEGELNLCLVQEAHEVLVDEACPVIHIPIVEKSVLQTASFGLELFHLMNKGLWVGANNTRNGVASYCKFGRTQ